MSDDAGAESNVFQVLKRHLQLDVSDSTLDLLVDGNSETTEALLLRVKRSLEQQIRTKPITNRGLSTHRDTLTQRSYTDEACMDLLSQTTRDDHFSSENYAHLESPKEVVVDSSTTVSRLPEARSVFGIPVQGMSAALRESLFMLPEHQASAAKKRHTTSMLKCNKEHIRIMKAVPPTLCEVMSFI